MQALEQVQELPKLPGGKLGYSDNHIVRVRVLQVVLYIVGQLCNHANCHHHGLVSLRCEPTRLFPSKY